MLLHLNALLRATIKGQRNLHALQVNSTSTGSGQNIYENLFRFTLLVGHSECQQTYRLGPNGSIVLVFFSK